MQRLLGRWILSLGGLEQGYLRIVDDRVEEVCHGAPPTDTEGGLVLPSFTNSHTHLGDSCAYPSPRGTVREIVGPPDGYKHRVLECTSEADKVKAMRGSIELMASTGTASFSDFREEGVGGIEMIGKALAGSDLRATILGRPRGSQFSEEELDQVLDNCDGLGMSSVSDWSWDVLKAMSDKCRSRGKMFALHASEVRREDVDSVLRLRPSYLVHMTMASEHDIAACNDAGVPIVVCPRSYEFFGTKNDIGLKMRMGAILGLGTDNAMISQPDMIEEMKAAYLSCRGDRRVSPADIVNLATFGGRKVLNRDAKITTESANQKDFVVVRLRGDDPPKELVTSAKSEDIIALVRNRRIWRRNGWRR